MDDPHCPHADACGGCPWMGQAEDERLARKAAWVGRFAGRIPDRVVASPTLLGTRARIRLRADRAGRLGYHEPRSHRHVAITTCPSARPEVDALVGTLPPLPGLETLELRSDGSRVVASAWRRRGGVDPVEALRRLEGGGLTGVALDGKALWGEVHTNLAVGGISHALSPETFYQVHLALNEVLVAEVGEAVPSGAAVLDLYAGAGNLSLPLALGGHPVVQIEASPSATADARRTARRHGLQVDVRTADASKYRAGEAWFEVAIVDPPRAGAGALLAELALTRPARIVVTPTAASTGAARPT